MRMRCIRVLSIIYCFRQIIMIKSLMKIVSPSNVFLLKNEIIIDFNKIKEIILNNKTHVIEDIKLK